MSRECPNAGEGAPKRACFKCGEEGHMAKECTGTMIDLTQDMPRVKYINKRRDFIETEDSFEAKPARRRRSAYDINLKAFSIPGITDKLIPAGDRQKGGKRKPKGGEMVDEAAEGVNGRKGSVSRSGSAGSRKRSMSRSVGSRKASGSVCSRKRSVSRSVGSGAGGRGRSASAEGAY